MKKLSIFLLCALGIMAASCSEDIEPATPQSNPQEPIMNAANDVKSEAVGPLALTGDAVFDLGDYDEPDEVIPVMQVKELENMPAGGSLLYKLELSDTSDFTNVQTLDTSVSEDDDTVYTVSAEEWNDAQVALFGNSIKTKTVYYRVPVYIVLADTEYRLESTSYYAASGTLQVNRMKPDYSIDDVYYVTGNYITGEVEMAHSDEDVYDDPLFTYAFEVTEDQAAAGYTINIVAKDENGNVTATYGVAVPEDSEGIVLEDGAALKVTEAGPYKLEVDMKELTYTLKVAPATLYVITSGTSFGTALQIPTSDFITYQGLARVKGYIRMAGQVGWNPLHYGAATEDQAAADSGAIGATTYQCKLSTTKDCLAWVVVNLVKLTYSVEPIDTLGICGELNGWGATDDVEFSHSSDFKTWTVEVESPAAGSQWKIRANNDTDWAINFGGLAEGDLDGEAVSGGANFAFPEEGKYEVVFSCASLPYTVTVTKK